MDSITQLLISQYDNVLNVGFICNLMLFTAVMEGISVMVGHFASLGRN